MIDWLESTVYIFAHARPCAHITPPRRIIAGYVGPAAGLRTALLTGAALRPAAPAATVLTAGGAR
ncbi:hypothetical protein [Micromonospora sp. RTGN7]|uniref:hypothetical protein n=1 Tax=Micromonospora sp. RTGN7 TaxID=3016526 RepID=UPI0029FF41A2|nr:hypothetical protein [Micromonospora sp. RTGN7]